MLSVQREGNYYLPGGVWEGYREEGFWKGKKGKAVYQVMKQLPHPSTPGSQNKRINVIP